MDQTLHIPSRPAVKKIISETGSVAVRKALSSPLLWTVFVAYLLVLGFAVWNHEPWGDEFHSWNIAKGSGSYADLIFNSRYEGHPPTWYTFMWTISKFTHDFSYVQLVQAVIASLTVFLVLFFSPFPFFVRVLLPFGYYFMYEYAVLSRNYAIGVLAAFCICLIIRRHFQFKWPLYYLLLLIMSNTHLLALVLAGCLHLYNLLFIVERKGKIRPVAIHVLLGALIFLPAVYFISPPSESQLNVQFWIEKWSTQNIKTTGQVPLRSLMPVPAWWKHNSWNTQFLLDADNKSIVLNFFIALVLLASCFLMLRSNKKSLTVFGINFLLSMLIAIIVFPLTSARYSGFIYISFIAAFWLYCYESPLIRLKKWLMGAMLGIQILGAIISVVKDFRYTFSNAYRVNELISKVPASDSLVTDYWAMNTISAFAHRPIWCVDMQKEVSFVLWGPELGAMTKKTYRYTEGVNNYFQQKGVKSLYMISFGSPLLIFNVDPQLEKQFNTELVDQIEGAIEKGGNLYLYKISSK